MFTSIKTAYDNKQVVTDLTRKLALGPENVIARIAFSLSLATNKKMAVNEIKDSKGKEYSKTVLFGSNTAYYVSMICVHYQLYKTDKDIPKYIKMHVDHGLELIDSELKENPNFTGFDYLMDKIEIGLKHI